MLSFTFHMLKSQTKFQGCECIAKSNRFEQNMRKDWTLEAKIANDRNAAENVKSCEHFIKTCFRMWKAVIECVIFWGECEKGLNVANENSGGKCNSRSGKRGRLQWLCQASGRYHSQANHWDDDHDLWHAHNSYIEIMMRVGHHSQANHWDEDNDSDP